MALVRATLDRQDEHVGLSICAVCDRADARARGAPYDRGTVMDTYEVRPFQSEGVPWEYPLPVPIGATHLFPGGASLMSAKCNVLYRIGL